MRQRRPRAAIKLPPFVHRVTARGRDYFYFHPGRGTPNAGKAVRLPDDPRSPEFWAELRRLQGVAVQSDTVGALVDAFLTSPAVLGLSEGTQDQYARALRIARDAWENLSVTGLRPVHVQAIVDRLASTPGKANNFLAAMRAYSSWLRVRDHVDHSITEGVKPYPKDKGHKPWTLAQIKAANERLTGVIRRGVILYMYTGMRGSDAVRLGWTDVDEGGFSLTTQKKKRDIWCPIVPELAAEIATWEKRPGPFLLQEDGRAKGRPYTRKLFSTHFREARDKIPELFGVTLHGLRCTAVIRLRRAGLSTGQIGDIVGMSLATIERYCRFADRKTSGQAALLTLARTPTEQNGKHRKTSKTDV